MAKSAGTEHFGRFEIESLVGMGGAGRVYRARDPQTDKILALKVINVADSDEDSTSRLRFRREFRAASRLDHPHLVKVYETGVFQNKEYYTMEFVEGYPFDDHLTQFEERLDAPDILNAPARVEHLLDLLIQIADALTYLHNNKFVHRDLKPGNVLVDIDNQIKLADFGLVRELGSSHMTKTGAILGTVEYMSPEQTITARVDCRSDIYSLGVMMFKAFTGSMPFTGGIMRQLVSRAKEEAPDPRSVNQRLNPQISKILAKMLKRRPEDRYPTAQLLLDDLLHIRETLFGSTLEATTTTMTLVAPASVLLPPVCAGRDAEIHQMTRALERLRSSGTSSMVIIRGETGVGKTRLAQELQTLAAFHGLPVLNGVCSGEDAPEFEPWKAILQEAVEEMKRRRIPITDDMARSLETIADVIPGFQFSGRPPRDSILSSAEANRYRLFDATLRFLTLLSQRNPLLIVLDNVQWAHETSLELYQFILHRAISVEQRSAGTEGSPRLMMVLAYRNNETGASHPLNRQERRFRSSDSMMTFNLQPLSEEATEIMIQSMLGGEHASPGFTQRIYRESSGNPLFIENVIQTLVQEGHLRRRGGVWVGATSVSDTRTDSDSVSLMIPTSIQEAARRRLTALSEVEQEVVQAAAVIGMQFDFDQLLTVSDRDENAVLDALDQLLRLELFQEKSADEEVYGFTAHHFRDVVYSSLELEQRKHLHRRAAEYLQEEFPRPGFEEMLAIARHLAETMDRRTAFPACFQAALALSERNQPDQALYFIDNALRMIPADQADAWHRLQLHRAVNLHKLGQLKDAENLYNELVRWSSKNLKNATGAGPEEPLMISAQFTALCGLARLHLDHGGINRAARIITTLTRRIEQCGDPQTRSLVYRLAAQVDLARGALEPARKNAQQALDIAREFPGPAGECCLLMGQIAFRGRDFTTAKTHFYRAIELFRTAGDRAGEAATLAEQGNNCRQLGELEDSLDKFSEAIEISGSLSTRSQWPSYLYHAAIVLMKMNRHPEALGYLKKALAVWEEEGQFSHVADCSFQTGVALTACFQLSEAARSFQKSLNFYKQFNHPRGLKLCTLYLGLLMIHFKQSDRLRSLLHDALELTLKLDDRRYHRMFRILMARVMIISGKDPDARSILKDTHDVHASPFDTALWEWAMADMEIARKTPTEMVQVLFESALAKFKKSNRMGVYKLVSDAFARYLIDSGADPDRGQLIRDDLVLEI